jgi:hypothetical protein
LEDGLGFEAGGDRTEDRDAVLARDTSPRSTVMLTSGARASAEERGRAHTGSRSAQRWAEAERGSGPEWFPPASFLFFISFSFSIF